MSTFDAGSIEASITADRSPLTRELRLAREQARKFEKTPIKIPITADRTGLTRELKNAREQIRRLTKEKFEVNIGAKFNGAKAEADIKRFKDKANSTTDVKVKADADTAKAQFNLDYLKHTANKLDHDKVTVKVDADTGGASSKLSLLQSQMLAARGGSSLLIGSLVAIGPAAIPVIAATSGAVMGLSGALAAAGGGAAVLGAGIIGNFMRAKEMSDLVTKAQKKLRLATTDKERKKAQKELDQARGVIDGLPGPLGGAANAILHLQHAWAGFLKSVQGPAFDIIIHGLNMVSNFLPRMTPLFRTFATVAEQGLGELGRFINGPMFSGFLRFFQQQGPTSMRLFMRIAMNLVRTLIPLLEELAPTGNRILRMIVRLTDGWANWAKTIDQNQSFQRFMAYAMASLPAVAEFVSNLVRAVVNLGIALAPIGAVVLDAVNGLLSFIAAMDPGTLRIVAGTILGIVAAISLLNGVMSIGAVFINTYKNIMAVWNALTKIATGLQLAFNAVMAANPILLVVAALALLTIGLVIAYKKSETFRKIVNAAWSSIKDTAQTVADWFTGPFVNFFKDIGAWFAGPFVGFFQDIGAWFTGPFLGFFKSVGAWFTGPFVGFFTGIWDGIVNGAQSMWRSVQPVLNAFQAAWQAVASFFQMVWHNYWSPIFQLFGAIVRRVFGFIFKQWIEFLKAEWRGVSVVFRAVWDNVIRPVFDGFAQIIRWVVNSVAKPLWRAMGNAWSVVAGGISRAYRTVIRATINAFAAAWRWVVNTIALPLWNALSGAWSAVSNAIRRVYRTTINWTINAFASAIRWIVNTIAKPLWNAMQGAWGDLGDAIKWTYNHVIKPIIDFFERRIKDLRSAFGHVVDGIRDAWDRLRKIAATPVHFVLETVLNNGLIAGFNKLAKIFGTDPMSPVPVPFATGSWVPGNSPTPTADNIPALLTAKEFVVRRQSAMKLARNEPGALEYMNETGNLPPMYGIGGWIGNALNTIGGAANSVVNWGKGLASAIDPVGLLKKVVGGLLNRIGGTAFAGLIKSGGEQILSSALGWMKDKIGFGGAAAHGPHLGGGYRWLENFVASRIPNAVVTSDVRPGARTIYGTPSAHGLGLAVDWGYPMRAIWNLLYPLRGRLHELLGPWGMFRDGQVYRDPTLQAMHRDHVHAATFGLGGLVVPTFDVGGTVGPGYNTIYNDIGRPETLVNKDLYDERDDELLRVLYAVLDELRKPQRTTLDADGHEFGGYVTRKAEGVQRGTVRRVQAGRKS